LAGKVKKLIEGIFGMDDSETKEPINTPEQQKIVDMVMQDFDVFKENRQQMDEQWRKEGRFYKGDQWHGLRPDHINNLRPSNVDNIFGAQIDSIVGKITGWDPYPDFEAQEESDEQKAQDLNDFMPSELRQIGFGSKYYRAIHTAVLHGPLIFKVIYDPTVEGGRGMNRFDGQNDIIPVDLGTFFPDPRVRDYIYLQKMGAVIIKTPETLEYFRERWEKQGAKVQSDMDVNDVEIFNHTIGSESSFNYTDSYLGQDTTNNKVSGLIEYWYRGLPKMVTAEDKELFEELATTQLNENKDPSEALAKADGKMEGIHCIYVSSGGVFLEHKAYVYDHGKYPFSARTLFPLEGNIHGKGFGRDMIKPQTMLNKFTELAIETMSKQGNSAIMYEEGSITRVSTWQDQRSTAGAMLPTAMGALSENRIKELQGVTVPSTVFSMIDYYLNMLQKIPGQFDSANGQASSNVTSGEQAKALIAAASNRLNPVTDAITQAMTEVFTLYIELIAQFYTTARVARVTGRKVEVSRDSLISGVPTTLTNKLDDGTEEMLDLTEEYVPIFDIKVNISADKPVDRDYWIATANNLIKTIDPRTGMPMIDARALLYTIEHGRMEPISVIEERMNVELQKQQELQQLQQQAEQLSVENQQLQQQVGQATQEQQAASQQDKEFNQSMQQQKMQLEAAKVAGSLIKDTKQPA
jgi:hypothetical protein